MDTWSYTNDWTFAALSVSFFFLVDEWSRGIMTHINDQCCIWLKGVRDHLCTSESYLLLDCIDDM